jgi:hypothetical protein
MSACAGFRERMLEAEPAELRGEGESDLARHVLGCDGSATDNSSVSQSVPGDGRYTVSANILWNQSGTITLDAVELKSYDRSLLRTTVNIRPGQTLVLGTAGKLDGGPAVTLLLTVRAEEAASQG